MTYVEFRKICETQAKILAGKHSMDIGQAEYLLLIGVRMGAAWASGNKVIVSDEPEQL
jgi:hypothetical protein